MTTSIMWKRFGDAMHLVSLTNVLLFAVAVIQDVPWFDPTWRRDGFCVSNPDTPYWTSHDLCVYACIVSAVIMAALYVQLRYSRGMEQANVLLKCNTLGVLGHCVGHVAIAKALRDHVAQERPGMTGWEAMEFMTVMDFVRIKVPFVLFWLLLLKAAMTKASWSTIIPCSILSSVCGLSVATKYGFTYVQTMLFLAFEINELLKLPKEKGFEYAMYPVLVGIPVGALGWIESTQCTNGVINFGGHLVYDAYIPVASMAFYLLCWLRGNVVIRRRKVA